MESPNPSDIKEVVVSLEQTLEHANESSSKICGDSILTTSETNALEESNVTERFAIFWHEECSLHEIKGHPEQPDRVSCILVALKKIYSEDCFRKAPIVTADQILLFHAESHLRNLISLCDNSERGFDENDDDEMYQSIDGDTVVMWKTRRAVWRAAGSVISAVDDLYLETGNPCRISSAFCCVRPPGHHAERNKPGGFCFLNNAGIAAKYAQHQYGVKKVAVLDFDVHHGNGTEEGFKGDTTLFYGSTHERDNYPGTGADPSPHVGAKALSPLFRRIVNRTLTPGPGSVPDFRRKWAEVVEEMEIFQPDFVIFSAGFDAHDEDPLANCELTDEDFAWATLVERARTTVVFSCSHALNPTRSLRSSVMQACERMNPTNPAPILSVLEGGYDLPALASSAAAHCGVLFGGYSALSKHSAEAESEEKHAVATAANQGLRSSADGDGEGDSEKSYGGDEAAALAAHIASLDLGPSIRRP